MQGLQLAIAIMLHNVPEGMAVAIPLYAATESIWQVLLWTFINGLAEPIGVVIGGFYLHALGLLSQQVLSISLAIVAGVMICISIHELLPTAVQHAGKNRASVWFFVGMAVCWGALELVEVYFGGHGHSHGGDSHGHGHGGHHHGHFHDHSHAHAHGHAHAHAHAHIHDHP
jgi:ZIP family zinc transporter